MATLRDIQEYGTYIEFSFLKCIPGDYEGCRLNFKHYKGNSIVDELDFGWTNLTIKNYVEVTSNFPLEELNNFKLNNLHTSFENHLYHLEWTKLEKGNTHKLHFFGSQQDFTLIVADDEIRQFGHDLKSEWEKGLNRD
ncbi:hypothetical protein NQ117_11375 [Paenibacillus sp. SC116]|uniref:hypothetical protein n=1 Tax=Paenibacillus sp. SC116 TaxID=2968986 RepID=UPI00215ABE3F|nr:hypothetical protein [Paenibacillus sp. SC116]MCR8844287.1 hypothetical protein [Paenibacillus sp. SC116]